MQAVKPRWKTRSVSVKRTSRLSRLLNGASVILTKLRLLPHFGQLMIAIALLVLGMLTLGCSTLSTPPSVSPRLPAMPPPKQSQPSEPILDRVLRNIEQWESRLRDTLLTP